MIRVRRREAEPRTAGPGADRLRRWGFAIGGPVLIVAAVLVVLHSFAFGGRLTLQHVDVLSQWLPTYCFLGKSLAAGHIPAWNPFVMGGVPFAADPQSGWTYLPAMALFSAMPCDVAMRWFIVLQPVLAGLGLFWFLRSEGLGRAASTTGGLVLALVVAESYIGISIPFSGTLAWTALMLAAASRLLRAGAWPARLTWTAGTAVAWGQVAAAHLSDGLVIASLALVVFVVVRVGADLRARRRTGRASAALAGLLVAALPLVNLAGLVPRLAYLSRTSLSLGYRGIQVRAAELAGRHPFPFKVGPSSHTDWPLGLTTAPGSYVGAAALVLALAAWGSRRHRSLALAFGLIGAISYALSIRVVAAWLAPHLEGSTFGQFYLHEPERFRFGTILAVPVLAAIGLEAWREAATLRRRLLLLAPGLLVWGVLPPLYGVEHPSVWVPVAGAVAGAIALAAGSIRPALAALVPVALAGELVAGGLLGQTAGYRLPYPGIERPTDTLAFPPLRAPTVPAGAYVRAGPIAATLQRRDTGRYLSLVPGVRSRKRGALQLQHTGDWPLLGNQRSTLFHLEDGDGYNPAQLLRYWSFVRAVEPKHLNYNAAFFIRPPSVARNLLQVAWVIAGTTQGASVRLRGFAVQRAVGEGRYQLYRVPGSPPRASAFTSWTAAGTPDGALRDVLVPRFPVNGTVVLEADPGFRSGPPQEAAAADYAWIGTQSARVEASTGSPAVVLVRNAYDPNWHATVDGRPAPVLAADYVDQGVPVPAGRHTVVLSYDDPAVGYGLLGTALSLAALLGPATFLRARRKSKTEQNHPPEVGEEQV
ncbi:MAG: YfhO family protein [Actinomycetota bacterium]|nr:YfhO family protein [Actinomycetota bacterium]